MSQKRSPKIAVIGAGMSGILTGIRFLDACIKDFTIYEKAERLGGTWRENTYPGLSCDVPSHLYSYSFELNAEWSRKFSPGGEIQSYFEKVAKKYDIEQHIRYNSEVTRLWMSEGKWRLRTRDGATDTVDFVICATGVLHKPVYPDIPGLDSFAGEMFHSARWNHDVSFDDKRMGIIGTGSTAIQITSAVVDRVKKLSLFQRTAQWVFPYPNPYFTAEDKESFHKNPAIMEHMYKSHSKQISSSFSRAVIGDQEQMQLIQDACENNLLDNVKDLELRARLTPDYKAACKRLIMSEDFYPAIQKDNAELVTDGIEQIEAGGIRTQDGSLHELDVLVLATGFDAHLFMRPMEIIGPKGNTLSEHWADTTPAYRSVALPGFPNLFMLLGPNSPIGNFSLIEVSEWQSKYILQLIEAYRDGMFSHIQPSQEATDAFNAIVKQSMPKTVWVTGCKSWYLDKHGNPAMWPFTFEKFCDDMSAPKLDEFELS